MHFLEYLAIVLVIFASYCALEFKLRKILKYTRESSLRIEALICDNNTEYPTNKQTLAFYLKHNEKRKSHEIAQMLSEEFGCSVDEAQKAIKSLLKGNKEVNS